MSVSQVDHSALLRLSGHSVFLYNKYGTNRVGSPIAPSQSSDSTLPPTRRCDGDVRRQSIAHSNDGASWSLDG